MDFDTPNRIPMRLDMAPLIDVVFLLLIFFMLTSSMSAPKAIELNLPSSSVSEATNTKQIIVSVNKIGEIYLNKSLTQVGELAEKVAGLINSGFSSEVSLEVDSETSVQQMVSVMDELKKAGGGNISLSTEASERPGVGPDSNTFNP